MKISVVGKWRRHTDGCEDYIVNGHVVGFWTGHGVYVLQRHPDYRVVAVPAFGPPRETAMHHLEHSCTRAGADALRTSAGRSSYRLNVHNHHGVEAHVAIARRIAKEHLMGAAGCILLLAETYR